MFDERDADGAVAFIEKNLKHWEGAWAGRAFELLPWQRKIIRDVFGWKRADGLRRYRNVYVEVPKGNGKSPLAAAIALLLLFWDGEHGAQVYSAAGDRDQARIVFGDAANMLDQSDDLAAASLTFKDRIVYPGNRGFYQVLSSQAPTKHGLRPHGVIIDELHVQRDRRLFDTLRFGMKKRQQPLFVMITTAGVFDEDSLCWTEHQYAKAVLSGDIDDPSYYAVIYGAEVEDDWTSDETFTKANPSIGVTVRLEDLREECNRALKNPVEQTSFKQLHLNVWGQESQGGFDMNAWRKCWERPVIEPGAECFVGLDLSSKLDLTAAVAVFPHGDGSFSLLPHFWIPEEGLDERRRRDVFDYPRFVKSGFITATSGNLVDQDAVRAWIVKLGETYNVREIGFDSWNATWISGKLQDEDGFTLVEMRQGFKTMSEPSKALVGLVLNRKLRHGANPVLTWCAGNTVFRRDPNDNWAPQKDKRGRKRIDGIVAAIMGLGRALVREDEAPMIMEVS